MKRRKVSILTNTMNAGMICNPVFGCLFRPKYRIREQLNLYAALSHTDSIAGIIQHEVLIDL